MRDDKTFTRRDFLNFGGALASSVVAGRVVGPPTSAGRNPETFFTLDVSPPLPLLQHFHSRPDLQPPVVTMHHGPTGVAPGVILTDCHNGLGQQGPLILDSDGTLVWFKPLSTASGMPKAFNLRVQSYKGKPIISWFEGEILQAHGRGHYELYDSSYRQVAEVHAGNGYAGDLHEFVITARGTALFTCYGEASADLSAYGGSPKSQYLYGVVQEVDLATGKVLFQWRSDEHVSLAESYVPPVPKTVWDYFHINSINVDPSDDNLIVSGRNAWAFYKINRTTGAVMWRVGGKKSNFNMGANTHFAFQHDVTPHPDGTITIFDNEAGPPKQASQSRALVVRLDPNHKQVSFVRQYDHDRPVTTSALGSVQDLPDGHCFVGWGESSYFTEYGPSSEVLLDGRLASGNVSYRAFKQPWTGLPNEHPAIAVATVGGIKKVFASWNGSTETAYWTLLGGGHSNQLLSLAKTQRSGFETAIELSSAPAYVAVEALDSSGRVLGRSSVVKAR